MRGAAVALFLSALVAGIQQDGRLAAQAPARRASDFDAVAVRRHDGPTVLPEIRVRPDGTIVFTAVPLSILITRSYGIQSQRIVGLEPWMNETFDIEAHVTGRPPDDLLFVMTQHMLEQRFGVRVHLETRQRQVKALVRAVLGGSLSPNIRPATANCSSAGPESRQFEAIPTPLLKLGPLEAATPCGTSYQGADGWRLPGITMSAFANLLAGYTSGEVVDRTNLGGTFQIEIRVPPPVPRLGQVPVFDTREKILAALPEQLGLTLEDRREPVEVLVVDRASRPVEN